MSIITVRVPKNLKRRMSKFKNVNWIEVVREAVLERIAVEEKLENKDWGLIRKAVSIYGAIYLATSMSFNTKLITSDKGMIEKLSDGIKKNVSLLGDVAF
jgi:predicted nucleic acid-binding protein